ncbi:hypothetical protein B0A49_01512 [Cryomyces minteri]|uniref:Uncharacterized protein n=1 Tax=Cryomyces minteri TaxID=331657 RepID=A0A4U0XWC0_9PEZI|nr:hypothetical protein B0A49_01512 [Cryomyces minteri]
MAHSNAHLALLYGLMSGSVPLPADDEPRVCHCLKALRDIGVDEAAGMIVCLGGGGGVCVGLVHWRCLGKTKMEGKKDGVGKTRGFLCHYCVQYAAGKRDSGYYWWPSEGAEVADAAAHGDDGVGESAAAMQTAEDDKEIVERDNERGNEAEEDEDCRAEEDGEERESDEEEEEEEEGEDADDEDSEEDDDKHPDPNYNIWEDESEVRAYCDEWLALTPGKTTQTWVERHQDCLGDGEDMAVEDDAEQEPRAPTPEPLTPLLKCTDLWSESDWRHPLSPPLQPLEDLEELDAEDMVLD